MISIYEEWDDSDTSHSPVDHLPLRKGFEATYDIAMAALLISLSLSLCLCLSFPQTSNILVVLHNMG